ncbi:MAG: molybdate ABC transporter substrate-binding protein [Gammaproteobacteria bacterium]
MGLIVLTASLGVVNSAVASILRIGVAANFAPVLQEMAEAFQQDTGHRVVLSSGSTGKLYAQIKHGAPYDLLFAADVERPQRLEAEGEGVPGTRFTYARGRLALWSRQPGRVDKEGRVLLDKTVRRIALANPQTAPYGAAAQQVLERLGVWGRLHTRLVRGENIAQTYQFVASGNAEMGFVALSQLRAKGVLGGSAWEVPESFHQPIEQQAILLKRAADKDAARAFLDFVRGERARQILRRYGYEEPDHDPPSPGER